MTAPKFKVGDLVFCSEPGMIGAGFVTSAEFHNGLVMDHGLKHEYHYRGWLYGLDGSENEVHCDGTFLGFGTMAREAYLTRLGGDDIATRVATKILEKSREEEPVSD